jgi:DNA polymerase epsilon subunit 1
MYPNIILTNRLQPSAIVDDSTCAACDFNQAKNNCKRKMNWVWRGDYNPATKSEYDRTKDQLSRERFEGGLWFHELSDTEQAKLISTRLKQYSKNAYNRSKITEEVTRSDTVCMRENDFYVNTVRSFRDKRYELKKLTKVWGNKVKTATDAVSKKEAEDRELVYDSLQVAHKCILNSFYGYVMRKGARWRSMEMAGIVTKTGADLITQARILVEQIGRPLELDTDGIWCILPQSFPDVFYFTTSSGSKLKLEYPCIMLNADVHNNFTNHQYQTLIDPKRRLYETRSECSIFFEVDGPYRCMVLPASTEEGKLLKKRYAVFNFDGSLAELKGFELKRRGELELIKTFQSQVFERFLNGNTLCECYDSVADIANHWLDVIDTQGESLETDELIDLISENRSMSRQLDDYGDQKGTSQTTARRLGEFLGAEIIKDKGLNCKFIIAERPHGSPVTERAIPTAIWRAEPAIMKHFLRKWLKSPQMEGDDFDLRNVLDWDYYRDRLGKTIQKIITIPAALQNIPNPVPRLPHPEWLQRTVRRLNDRYQQKSITSMFGQHQVAQQSKASPVVKDIEDTYRNDSIITYGPLIHRVRRKNAQHLQTERSFDNGKERSEGDKIDLPRVKLSGESFQDWLAWKKSIWKFEDRRKRSRQKQVASSVQFDSKSTSTSANKKQRKALGSMEGFLRDATQSLADKEWHILEIRDASHSDSGSANGELILWVMLSNGTLQRITIIMPRTIYVDCKAAISEKVSPSFNIRRVEKHLPHNKASEFLYEVTMTEYDFRSNLWLDHFKSKDGEILINSFYELGTSQILRAILHIGCMCRLNATASGRPGRLTISDLKPIERPTEGQYLNSKLPLRKIFFYERFYTRSRIGLVAVFINKSVSTEVNEAGSIDLTSQCFLWIVKPGGEKAQRNISRKICESMFAEILQVILQTATEEVESKYTEISPTSICSLASLNFVDSEDKSFKGVHDVLTTYSQANNGPTLLLLNSMKNVTQIRKRVPSSNSYPIILLPPPPGAEHRASAQSVLSLNWENESVQRCFEAFIHANAESLKEYTEHARYARIPMGNLGIDPVVCSYDVLFARSLQKHRALLWSSTKPGCPDAGLDFLSLAPGSSILRLIQGHPVHLDSNEIWGEENETMSPIVSYPGAYRAICAEIDVQFLVIAALNDLRCNPNGSLGSNGLDVAMRGNNAPLGDVMSTAISLPILRSLVQQWLHDTMEQEESSAGMLLDHVYRLVSSPASSLNDPALHRVVVSLMKAAFNQLLGEFQRLGSTIIFANFNRIVISTNKSHLSEAIEYVDFVIATIKKRMESNADFADFSRISLQRNTFYAHYIFLDEHNYGGVLFENREPEDYDEEMFSFNVDVPLQEGQTQSVTVVPTVLSAWNIMRYLPGEITQTYFRLVIGRFSKDVYRKQIQIDQRTRHALQDEGILDENKSKSERLRAFKKNLISKQFASYLTKCVGEIIKEGGGPESFPDLPGSHLQSTSPVLEFIKNVIAVLELDSDVYTEVQQLKKSLLAQISVQEYSSRARWVNPCASFVLPNVFCSECQECRDLNLCILPISTEQRVNMKWTCIDCGTPYDSQSIEQKLVDVIQRKCLRYQMQDLRCRKTGQVSTRCLSRQSETSQKLKLDITREDVISQLLILNNLARFYDLEWLLETTKRLLHSF